MDGGGIKIIKKRVEKDFKEFCKKMDIKDIEMVKAE